MSTTDGAGSEPLRVPLSDQLDPLPSADWKLWRHDAYEDPYYSSQDGYTADDMIAYASGQVAAERERWRARVEQAFREGYWARETYNDSEVSDADEKWASAKAGLVRA